jgi:hypothetical protein
MFDATRLIRPAGSVAGVDRSIMCARSGALPPVILVMPVSANAPTWSARRVTTPENRPRP